MHKIIKIAVIFTILGCWGGQGFACSADIFYLRVPVGIGKNRVAEILTRGGSLKGLPQDPHPPKAVEEQNGATARNSSADGAMEVQTAIQKLMQDQPTLIKDQPNKIALTVSADEIAQETGLSKAAIEAQLDQMTADGDVIAFCTSTGQEPEEARKAFAAGKITSEEFLRERAKFYRQNNGEIFLISGRLLKITIDARKKTPLSDQNLHKMAQGLRDLFGDRLNYTLRRALSIYSYADFYWKEDDVAKVASVIEKLKEIEGRTKMVRRDILGTKNFDAMSRDELIFTIRVILDKIAKSIEDVRWLKTQDISALEQATSEQDDAKERLTIYKVGLITGLAHLEAIYSFYSAVMVETNGAIDTSNLAQPYSTPAVPFAGGRSFAHQQAMTSL